MAWLRPIEGISPQRMAVIGLRLIVGVAVAVFAGRIAWHTMLDPSPPGPRMTFMLAELAWVPVTAAAAAWAAGAREWRIVSIADAALIVALGWKGWQLRQYLHHGRWGWLAVLAFVLLVFQVHAWSKARAAAERDAPGPLGQER